MRIQEIRIKRVLLQKQLFKLLELHSSVGDRIKSELCRLADEEDQILDRRLFHQPVNEHHRV